MPISGNPNNDKRQIPAGKIKGAKATPGYPTKPGEWQTGLNWLNINIENNNNEGTDGGENIIIDPPTIIDPILPPPPPPPPGTNPEPFQDLTTNDIVYATQDNAIYISTDYATQRQGLEKDIPQAIAQIKQKFPQWNGKNGPESAFITPKTPEDKIVVEHIRYNSDEWNKLNDQGLLTKNNKRWRLKSTAPHQSHKPTDPNYFEQNPNSIIETSPHTENRGYWNVFKIYNTYWNNQGTYLGESGGQNYYKHRDLYWIQDIIKLPDTDGTKLPINPKLAFAGTIQKDFTFLNKNPNALDATTNATGMFYYNPKFNQQINLPNITRAEFIYGHNLEYNQPAQQTPNLETNAYAYYYTPKFNNTPLHSENVKWADSLFEKAKTLSGDLSYLQYPLIDKEPPNYRLDTAITKTYWG
jgi:hypothetical protein